MKSKLGIPHTVDNFTPPPHWAYTYPMRWTAPKEAVLGAYMTIDREAFTVVAPFSDTAPHDLNSRTCACNPTLEYGSPEDTHFAPFVIHGRFEDKERIDRSLATIHAL